MMSIGRCVLAVVTLMGAVLVPASASAQLNTVGVRLGVSRANHVGGFRDLIADIGGEMQARTGFVAGAFVDYGLLDGRLSIQAGADLAQKGMRIPADDVLRERTLDITYLDVPVLAKAWFAAGQYRPYVVAGPVLSLKMSEKREVDGQEIEFDDGVKGSDLGFALGIGGRRDRFGLELRYVLGLSNISESSNPDEAAKNRQWSLVATYALPIRL